MQRVIAADGVTQEGVAQPIPSTGAIRTYCSARSPAALVVLGADPVICSANRQFTEVIGSSTPHLSGRHPLFWAEVQSAIAVRRTFDAAARVRCGWSGDLLLVTGADGRPTPIAAMMIPLFADDGTAQHGLLRLDPRPVQPSTVAERAAEHARRSRSMRDNAKPNPGAEAHQRATKALRLLAAMISREAPLVRDRRGRSALSRLRDRAGVMAHVLDVLNSGADISLQGQIERLSAKVHEHYPSHRADTDITFNVSAQAVPWDADRMVMLMLIIFELAANALRHAFPDGMNGTVNIRLYRVDDIVRLYVEDDGCGIAPDAFVKDSFGVNLVEALVRNAGGSIAFEAEKGTSVMVRLPMA